MLNLRRLTIDPYISPWEAWLQKWWAWLFVPAILVNAGGLFIDILEPDGALYATIAKTMARTGDLIHLRVDGKDWLDKPHFPFWMAALSFRVFGVGAFAYKLPALLFWALGGWYTFRLAQALYGKPVAQLAALIYVSAAHLVISNNDVRAEPYLTGLVIGSVFHFYKASRARPGWHLVAGSFLAACAVMTKGPFVLITISGGFIVDWIRAKEWQQFGNGRWWIALLLIALFILPELYCLYQQFDLHPEKEVFGRTGVSGLRFFFWDSQFGRFFNTGPIKGSGDPFFYFHTLLWAFLPWSLILYAAIVQKCRKSKTGRGIPGELICLGAALISFVVFSLSRFQLPHYLNILFPFFSILAAGYLYDLHKRSAQRAFSIIQYCIAGILIAFLLFLSWLVHFEHWVLIICMVLVLAALPFFLFRGRGLVVAATRSCCAALIAYGFINFCLYPTILRYQAGTVAGKYVEALYRQGEKGSGKEVLQAVYLPEEGPINFSFEFYCPAPVLRMPMDSILRDGKGEEALVFLPAEFLPQLVQRGYKTEELKSFPNFHISQLTGEFLNYRTRDRTLGRTLLVRVTK